MTLINKQQLFISMGDIFNKTRQYLDNQFKVYDLNRPAWLILAILRVHPQGISQLVAQSHVGIETSYFTKTLNKLEERNFVIREIDKNDRRNRILKLNPKQPLALQKILATIAHVTQQAQLGINQKQLEQFYQTLNLIEKNIDKYIKESS